MTHAWFDLGNGRKVYRRVPEPRQKPSMACPYIVRPFSEPVQSMADGKFYTDAASLRATYKASGNPQGIDYIEVGNEDITTFTPPQRDRKADREAIEKAINAVEYGDAPPVLTTDEYPI